MNTKLKAAALAVVAQFEAFVALRGGITDKFVDPFSKTERPNAVTIDVVKLRELAEAVQSEPTFTPAEVMLLKKMVADRLANIAAHLKSLEASTSLTSETTRMTPRTVELTNLRDKLRAMQG